MPHTDETSLEKGSKASHDLESSDVPQDAVPSLPNAVPEEWDKGPQAWMTLVGAFIMIFCSSGYVNSFGVFEDYYTRIYLSDFSSSTINWIAGVQTFLMFAFSIFSGYAMDIGYFHPVMWLGSLLLAFCLLMISFSHPQQWYQLFLAQGIGLGAAIGVVYVPSLAIVTHHFKNRRSLAMGIAASGSSFGGVVHPIMLNQLFNSRVGFHWGMRVSALFNLILLVAANLLMSTRLPPQKKKFRDIVVQWGTFLKDPAFIAGAGGCFLLLLGTFFPILFLQLDSIKHGINTTLAFYIIAMINGASTFGRILPTIIADRTGVFILLVPSMVACGVINASITAVTTAAGAIIVALVYGFFSGSAIALAGPMVAKLSPNMSEAGARIGLCYGIGGISTLIGPPITGALLSSKLNWLRPSLFNGISMLLGALVFAVAGWLAAKRKAALN